MSEQSFNQPQEDEISFNDIINFLLESWKMIVLSGFVGGVLAIGYVFIAPVKYQATANIQVAKVAGSDVEPPSVLVEKLKIPSYFSTASHSACNLMDAMDPGVVIAQSIKPILSKDGSMINFSYRDGSREGAQKCLESILNDVRNRQNVLAKPVLDMKKNLLINLKKKLDASEKIVKTLTNKNLSFDFSDSKFSAATLFLATTLAKENEIQDLRIQIDNLETSLVEPQTTETFLSSPIYVPKQKVSSSRARILMVGLMAGLFFGLFFMIGKRSLLRYQSSHQ